MEQRDGEFIPDLILYNATDAKQKIYIEIAVTHSSTEEKRQSGSRIIEINVQSEADIDNIRKMKLTEADAEFIHFTKKPIRATKDECSCDRNAQCCLVVYSSGKCFLEQGTLASIIAKYSKKQAQVKGLQFLQEPFLRSITERGQAFVYLVEEAYKKGLPVRNCYVCRYMGENWSSNATKPVFCKYLRKQCGTNEAADCQLFRGLPVEELRKWM